MNSCYFIGNCTREPVVKSTQNGKVFATFSIACNRSFTDKDGNRQESADFVNVICWDFLAKKAGNGLKKGSRCFVHGRMNTRPYEKDGQKMSWTEIIADNLEISQFVDTGYQKQQGYNNQQQGFNQGYNNQGFNQQQQNYGNQQFQGGGNFGQFGSDENIPF